MTSWTVLWRGMRYRAGRSLLVLLLATVATTAAAVVPAYVRGAQESVAQDLLGRDSAADTSLHIQMAASRNEPGAAAQLDLAQGTSLTDSVIARAQFLRSVVVGTASSAATNLKLTRVEPGYIVTGQLAFRGDVCGHVAITGRCPSGSGEVMVSARTAEHYRIAIGDRLPIALGKGADEGRTAKAGGAGMPQPPTSTTPSVVGLYQPTDAQGEYWKNSSLLGYSPVGDIHLRATFWTIDAVFAGVAADVETYPGVLVRRNISYWLDLDDVDLAEAAQLDSDLRTVTQGLSVGKMSLRSALPALIVEMRRDQDAIASTVPVGAVPLLVLVLAVLMVLVAALTEERGPEIALAKLHGYAKGRVGAFGLGEVLFLITLAAPLGLALSWVVMSAMAALWLAPGTSLRPTWHPLAAVGIALLIGYASAAIASRRVFRTRIVNLMRRVPQRTTWRASALEGATAALAIAALVTTAQDRESGLAILSAPMLAIVAGIIGGRVISLTAGVRLRRARKRADVTGMLTAAGLARRPGRQRIVVVVAVATALMGFSATAWDVAAQARAETANGAVGSAVVYEVSASDAQRLLAGVTAAVPDGSAMAVVRRPEYYSGDVFQVMGVQSDRIAKVVTWFQHTPAELSAVAAGLRPPAPEPYPVSGPLTIRMEASGFGKVPGQLAVEVKTNEEQQTVLLGQVRQGVHDYTAIVPDGVLAVLKLIRPTGQPDSGNGTLTVQGISSAKGALPVGGADGWQPVVPVGVRVDLQGDSQLRAKIEASGDADVRIVRLRGPKALPVLITGAVPAEQIDQDASWPFMGFANVAQPFRVVQSEPSVPGANGHGMLVDLEYGLTHAIDTTNSLADEGQVFFEVWASAAAPDDLAQRLAAQGVQVRSSQTLAGYEDRLGRRAPALALRLYGLGGLVAVLLALGIVLLAVRVGSDQRRYGLAALMVAGLPERVLRRGIRREFLTLLGWPSVVGFAVGVVSAVLMLPVIPLVSTGVTTAPHWQPAPGALAAVAAACLGCLLIALPVAVRLVGQSSPELLRGES